MTKYELKDIAAAVNCHVLNPGNGQFMPKPADIIRYLEGDRETQALQAWSKVIKAIETIDIYNSVVFDDGLIHAVLNDMGGWIKLCQLQINEFPFRAQEFIKRYCAYLLHKPKSYPNQLIGIFADTPVMVGNQQQALLVLHQQNIPTLVKH